jgi:putative cell wall-binding protein
MTVTPPSAWGKLTGLVEGESCIAELYPIPGASVDATPTRTEQPQWRMVTDGEGRYARWIDTRVGELELIASAAMHLSESALVTPSRGQVTEQDFDLLHATCEVPPGPIHPDVRRIYGTDRYGTAAALAQTYAPGVETVFVATGATYPDAIAAAARAGSLDAPVLLTRPGSLPSATSVELKRLDPQEVVVLGGEAAVSDAVVRAVETASAAPTRRLAGTDRYRTAALIAAEVDASDVVFVATGQDYPDALAGAARAGALDAPVLLTRTDSLPSATVAQLERLDPGEIVVLGGTGAVSADVETALEAYGTVTRVAGANRYATAAAVAEAYPTVDGLYIASGQNWPDALAGAARAGSEDVPMLLVRTDSVPGVTWSSLERLEPGRITVLGGPVAVSEEVVEQLRTLE